MDGVYEAGWYIHPSLGLIRIFLERDQWFYQCFAEKGHKPLSKARSLDQWTWALSQKKQDE